MSISVIISNLNGARFLPRLLESLHHQRGVALQIIVVDRESKDDSLKILAEHPEVEVVSEPPESGLVTGYSVGARRAKHPYLFFCNEDMWFSRDCLRLVREQFDVPDVGRVGASMPFQLNYDGSRMINGGVWFTTALWSPGTPYPFRAGLSRHLFTAETVAGINAGAFMITRAAYDDVGGWDTSFFLDYEDLDLNIRLWQRGWTSRIDPRALVYHAVGASNGQQIHNGRSTVAKKRYVAALSNQLIVGMKFFTGWAPVLVPVVFGQRVARDLARGHFENLRLDAAAALLTLQRLPAAIRYRKEHRDWNEQRPGQGYFTEERFDAGTPLSQPVVEAEDVSDARA